MAIYNTINLTQKTPTITVSTNSITLNSENLYQDVTITATGNGQLSVTSSDTTICTITKQSGDVYRITSTGNTGNAKIYIQTTETKKYAAAQSSIGVQCSFATIYGVEWDGTSTTSWTRTDSAVGFTDPVPAVNNGNGSSPFDNIMPWSGMVREEISSCGTMVKIPKFWYKWTRSGSTMKLQISDGQKDGFYTSPAHTDRGDGNGQRVDQQLWYYGKNT